MKCIDSVGMVSFSLDYGGENSASGAMGMGLGKNKIFFYNATHIAAPGYNWVIATAYDESYNYGQNISIYYYETPEKPYPKGEAPIVKILSPKNGSIVYSRNINISAKCAGSNNIVMVEYAYGGKNVGGGGGHSVYNHSPVYYFNFTPHISPGYNWAYAFAYDENGSMGYDVVVYYYNTSKDKYPPEIEIWWPPSGKLIMMNREICNIPYNFSIVLFQFKFLALVEDLEEHLQKIQLYLDNNQISERYYNNGKFDGIYWNCDRILLGMHQMKITAMDSFGNTATKQVKYFIVNFA